MTDIQNKLLEYADSEYAKFEAKLAPTISAESCLGVRVPNVRKIAKEISGTQEADAFMSELPHRYYDENMLHSVLISGMKNYDRCVAELERFLPYVDNWAACDTLRPAVFMKNKAKVIEKVREWIASSEVYTCRFGIDMLMTYFLDKDFKEEYLKLPASVTSDEYYVKMMVAWYFATALTKQWDAAVTYIEKHALPDWTHRKTIQKACESYRITPEQKTYLRTLI